MIKRLLLFIVINISILYATTPTQESITRLYIATFNRVPDSAGVEYWLNSKLSLEDIAKSFFDQNETKRLYPNYISSYKFIHLIYENIFERKPDISGYNYWKNELEHHNLKKSIFILTVINGALGDDATLLNNKTKVGLYFIKQKLNNISLAKDILKGVNRETATINRAKRI